MNRLFSLRAESLLKGLVPEKARARLSGLLIGLDLAGATGWWLGQRVCLLGAGELARTYRLALARRAHPRPPTPSRDARGRLIAAGGGTMRPIIAILRGITRRGRPHLPRPVEPASPPSRCPSTPRPFDLHRRHGVGLGPAPVGAGTGADGEDVARVARSAGASSSPPKLRPRGDRATVCVGLEKLARRDDPHRMLRALGAGATGLKIFPGSLLGPEA
jgi:hypothetical protein